MPLPSIPVVLTSEAIQAEVALVEYGSSNGPHCQAGDDIVAGLRNRLGD